MSGLKIKNKQQRFIMKTTTHLCSNAVSSTFYLLTKKTNMKQNITKMLGVLLFTLFTVLQTKAGFVTFSFAASPTGAGTTASGTPTGYPLTGVGTYYKATAGGTVTFSTVTGCGPNAYTSAGQMGSSLFIFKPTVGVSKITIYGTTGTGSTRALAASGGLTTCATIAGTYVADAGVTTSSTMAGGTGSCGNIVITPSSTIAANTFIKITLTGNAYITQIDFEQPCTAPTFTTNLSISNTGTTCQNGTAFSGLTVAASGATYQWYSNTTASNSGGTLISGATNATYTPSNSAAGTLYYYCVASTGAGCNTSSVVTGAYTTNAAPTPTFTSQPTSTTPINTTVTYTTQSGQSSYVWNIPGTNGVDYDNVTGGTSTDNSLTLTWRTSGSKTVTVGYTSGGCASATLASNTTNVSASVYYNKANSDVTDVNNWATDVNGTGTTHPSNFTDAGQTFNLYNAGATMSGTWDVQGAGTKVEIGDGTNAVTFNATQVFTTTSLAIVDVANNAILQLSSSTLPTFGILASGSTVDYTGTSQTVTPASYSNLTISGIGATLSGTANISGVFTPGSLSATSSTVVLNGTTSGQIIPAFAYNNLIISGADGKSTSGNISVSGLFTMNNSCTVSTGNTFTYLSTATLSTTSGKTLTVNGTFDDQLNSAIFDFGAANMTVSAGATFKVSGTTGNSIIIFTNNRVTLTGGIGVAGSTLYIGGTSNARLLAAVPGNVIWNTPTLTGTSSNLVSSASNTIGGNFTIMSTGTSIVSHATGGVGRAITVGGDLIMTGGRYDVSGSGATTQPNALTVNGNVNLSGTTDTLYASNSTTAVAAGTINIKGNLVHSGGVMGVASGITNGTFTFNGTVMQDINTINGFVNASTVTLNNTNGARLLSDVAISGTLTLTSGKLRTNNFSVNLTGTTSTITGATFGAAATSYIATCDGSGTAATTGGLTIQNIGSGGRGTSAISFPIGTNTTYNPATVTNVASAVAYTARVNNTPLAGVSPSTDAVKNTWNIQPASGTPSTAIALQWSVADEGGTFTRTAASIAHSTGAAIDVYTSGGAASGANPYTLNPSSYPFTVFGDFGVMNGVIIPATEPTVQASGVSVTAANTSMTINFTKSTDGSNTVIVVKQGSAVTAAPTDGVSYTDGAAVFTSGSNLGSGNYIVYNGSGTSVTVTGLAVGTTYHVAAYSFNGSNGTENYLTTGAAIGNATTSVPTYYYVGAAGSTANNFATTNMWASTVNGTPLAGFTPSNSDVFIFDGSNLGGGFGSLSTDTATISVATTSSVGKIIFKNNAKIKLNAPAASVITVGNAANATNTVTLDVQAGSTLKMTGSQNAITLANNSSASISGNFYLGAANGISQLLPGTSGSTVTINNGGYIEFNSGSNNPANTPFGSTGTNVVSFANGSTLKILKGGDVFGGVGSNVVSFAPTSLYWFANSGNSGIQTFSGRTLGNVKVDGGNLTPVAGAAGFTIYNIDIVTAHTLTLAETGSNCHIKGNINVLTGGTLKFSSAANTTCYFDGTSLQTVNVVGTWSLSSAIDQSFIVSNTAGISFAGATNLSSVAGSSLTINSGCNLDLSSGALNIAGGTLNLNGTLSRTTGTINASNTGATINNTGVANFTAGLFTSNTIRTLTINRGAGVSIGSDLTISTALNLTNGVVNMGSNTMIITSGATVARTSGWINGNLRKNIATGGPTRTYEVGDATNYTPATLVFTSVTTAGDIVVKAYAPASTHPNFGTSPINNANYVNRLWSITNATSITYGNYAATLNYVSGDKVGAFSESNAVVVKYNTNWISTAATSAASNQNTASGFTGGTAGLGVLMVAEPCVTVTPSISIVSNTTPMCSGGTVTFTATGVNTGSLPIYQWRRNGVNAGTSSSTTFPANTLSTGDVITCKLTANNNCQTVDTAISNGITLTVLPSPAVTAIKDAFGATPSSVVSCIYGGTLGLYASQDSGLWSSSNTGVASVVAGSAGTSPHPKSGLVTVGSTSGTAIISYGVVAANGCPGAASVAIVVNPQAAPNTSTGTTTVCVFASTTISNNTTIASGSTAAWSIAGGRATINNAGLVVTNSAGATNAVYTITNSDGCKNSSSLPITINPLPGVPTITYASGTINPATAGGYCTNRTFTLVGTPATSASGTGVWSKTGVISVTNLGAVSTGLVPGAASIKYAYTNLNGCTNSRTITSAVVACASRQSIANSQQPTVNEFSIYPNPAKSVINLNIKTLVGAGSIVVTNLYGKQLKTQSLSLGSNAVDISNFAKGLYLVSIITSEGKKTEKLIVE
jgi:fibronectin-binding autotransporter adhesin